MNRSLNAWEMLYSMYGIETRFVDHEYTLGVTAEQILPNNPKRVGLTFSNLGGNVVGLRPGVVSTLTSAIYVAGAGGNVTLELFRDFALVNSNWYAISAGAGNAFYVIEVLIKDSRR